MHVLGTAGHVDHGKSTLVKALTGIDPDRLPEEKERGLTIELGFAWFETEAGPLGVVDVPGHERFVRTMVAGAGGIDIVLLVVAADDGWMPQTQEHLDILRLLDIHSGIVVLSKSDLADPTWLGLVEEDIRAKAKGSFLEGAPIVRVDALHGTSLDDLTRAIVQAQKATAQRQDRSRGRLAIDRVFTMAGQGTVVTGTLRDGSFKKDQKVYLFPSRMPARLRSIQTHKHELDSVPPGSRVAANLAGVEKQDVSRGMWLYAEPACEMPRFVGVELSLVAQVPMPLKHGTQLLLICGTTEVEARLNLPTQDPLKANDRTVAQLELESPMAARFGDRFIVRLPTPQHTVAGGRVLEPSPHRYGRRHTTQWHGLAELAGGAFSDYVRFRLAHDAVLEAESIFPFFPDSKKDFDCLLATGAKAGTWETRGDRLVRSGWLAENQVHVASQVKAFHLAHPSQSGPLSAELLVAIPLDLHVEFLRELAHLGVRAEGPVLCHQSHRAGLTTTQEELASAWRKSFEQTPFAGPTRTELLESSADAGATLEFLLKSGELIELKDGVLLRTSDYKRAVGMVVQFLKTHAEITVAGFRDTIGATRKYALPILDRCDRLGYTKRVGDTRVLGPRASEILEERAS